MSVRVCVDMRRDLCSVCFTHPVKSKTALSVFINLPPLFSSLSRLCGVKCVCPCVSSDSQKGNVQQVGGRSRVCTTHALSVFLSFCLFVLLMFPSQSRFCSLRSPDLRRENKRPRPSRTPGTELIAYWHKMKI